MNRFPSISRPSQDGFTETTYRPVVRSEFESNIVRIRPKPAHGRRKYRLQWNSMTDSDYLSLQTFFLENSGTVFEFPNPLDENDVRHVTFSDSTISATSCGYAPTTPDGGRGTRWKVSLELEEIDPITNE